MLIASPTIYFISGLGADHRIFRKLRFPPEYKLIHIMWITPYSNESLQAYALRLAETIDQSEPYYLVGVSFGGFLATEIAKVLKPQHTFIVSSVPVKHDLPWYYKLPGTAGLLSLLPVRLMKSANKIVYYLFGATTRSEKMMLKNILLDTDATFLKWALLSSFGWDNKIRPINLTHIHGSADHILPVRYTQPDYLIAGGGHLMIFSDASAINELFMELII